MAFFSGKMLEIALQLSQYDEDFQDMALRFLQEYLKIANDINKSPEDGGKISLRFDIFGNAFRVGYWAHNLAFNEVRKYQAVKVSPGGSLVRKLVKRTRLLSHPFALAFPPFSPFVPFTSLCTFKRVCRPLVT